MTELLSFSNLNDFIFCPASIYFHNLYQPRAKMTYQESAQINGSKVHRSIDTSSYSSKSSIKTAISVYSEKFGLYGKIDIYDQEKKSLVERKKRISNVYDGYIFQLYGQYFAMKESGFEITSLHLHSIDDNKTYNIALPEEDEEMLSKFLKLIDEIKHFCLGNYTQSNKSKCTKCIYSTICDRSLYDQ